MNTVMLFLVAIPALEIFLMIKVGENIGALNTVAAIFLTAIVGIYFAKIEGLNTLRSGISTLYKNTFLNIPIKADNISSGTVNALMLELGKNTEYGLDPEEFFLEDLITIETPTFPALKKG